MSTVNRVCIHCGDDKILYFGGKLSDMGELTYKKYSDESYIPDYSNIGSGDYINITFCLNCGKIQDKFPIDDRIIKRLEKGNFDDIEGDESDESDESDISDNEEIDLYNDYAKKFDNKKYEEKPTSSIVIHSATIYIPDENVKRVYEANLLDSIKK